MIARAPSLIAALILTIPIATNAQIGSRLDPRPAQLPADGGISDADRVRRVIYDYAECVVRRSPGSAEKYLATFPSSKQASRIGSSLAVDACLATGQIRFNEPLLRGGVYDVLYRMKFHDKSPLDFTSTPAIDYSLGSGDHVQGDLNTAIAIRQLADCTVRLAPADARALIMSKIASAAEASAFTALVPHMSSCLKKDVTLKFSKPVFRGVIGETLYRLSMASREATSATKE